MQIYTFVCNIDKINIMESEFPSNMHIYTLCPNKYPLSFTNYCLFLYLNINLYGLLRSKALKLTGKIMELEFSRNMHIYTFIFTKYLQSFTKFCAVIQQEDWLTD